MESSIDLTHWLILLRTPGIGPVTYKSLLEQIGPPEVVLERLRSNLTLPGLNQASYQFIRQPDRQAIDADLAWAAQPDNHIIHWHHDSYPPLLREIPDPPMLLFVTGNPSVLQTPQLAMVGSRNPTAAGAELAQQFAQHLVLSGLTITSGLALGIDAASHRGALKAGGHTVAVTGTGPDRIYPRQHHDLAGQIASQGVLVTEYPTGTKALPGNFPRRNRIIAGLSLGTLVVEASLSSGSLISARLAADQGREVFAIPGSIHNPLARGCHQLLRDGAKLVETVDDILCELGPMQKNLFVVNRESNGDQAIDELDDSSKHILELIGYAPTSTDTLVQRSGLTVEAVSSILLLLELHGLVNTNCGLYTRR